MAGNCILKDGILLIERYGSDLDKLSQDDRVGLMRTSEVQSITTAYRNVLMDLFFRAT